MTTRYLDPLTDFGFKHLFGSEPNKDLLMAFLNALLPSAHRIASLEFRNPEWVGKRKLDRRAFFDLYCVGTNGERFIVELQRVLQRRFRDRCFYYSTFAVQEQALVGQWDYRLAPVYVVAILDFEFDDSPRKVEGDEASQDYLHVVQLTDQRGRVFYDKYMQIYVELPRFRKTEEALATEADRWLYFLRHLAELDAPPAGLDGDMFDKAFHQASLTQLSESERAFYEESMRSTRDLRNAFITTQEDSEARGRRSEKEELALRLCDDGLEIERVARLTGLSVAEVQALLDER